MRINVAGRTDAVQFITHNCPLYVVTYVYSTVH